MAEPRVQNFLRIGGADGGDLVGGFDGALHEVGATVKFDHMGIAGADTTGVLQNIQAVFALIRNVVDGENGLDLAELVQMTVVQVQIDGGQGRLPVIAVDDVRLKIGVEQHFENGAGEESKTLAVIVEAVQAAALEVVLVVDKVEGHAVQLALEQAAILAAPAHRHTEVGNVGQGILELQIAVQRHDNAAIHAILHQGFGQGTRNVSQTAGLCIRGGLTGSIQNFHKYLRVVGESLKY